MACIWKLLNQQKAQEHVRLQIYELKMLVFNTWTKGWFVLIFFHLLLLLKDLCGSLSFNIVAFHRIHLCEKRYVPLLSSKRVSEIFCYLLCRCGKRSRTWHRLISRVFGWTCDLWGSGAGWAQGSNFFWNLPKNDGPEEQLVEIARFP